MTMRAYDVDRPRSGKNKKPRRLVSQTAEEFEAQDAVAAEQGKSWSEWVGDLIAREMRKWDITTRRK